MPHECVTETFTIKATARNKCFNPTFAARGL